MKDSLCCQSKRQIPPWGKFFTPLSRLFLPANKLTEAFVFPFPGNRFQT